MIVVSTTGDGDPPPNAEKFMRRIKKRILSSTYLDHLHYALLGKIFNSSLFQVLDGSCGHLMCNKEGSLN